MSPIRSMALPADALLQTYRRAGAYTDCYVTEAAGEISHAEYVEAFYTTPTFKLERLILAWLVAKPSSDDDARELAAGRRESFAAWSVEARAQDQLLMCDFQGRTRSWLMVAPGDLPGSTKLYFGSAVVPVVDRRTGASKMGFPYRALLGFHKLYSRTLLRAAAGRVANNSFHRK